MAPEVIQGKPHTAALDMFAVGVMLYICIAGGRPMTPKQANTLTYANFEAWEYPNMPVRGLCCPLRWSAGCGCARACACALTCMCPGVVRLHWRRRTSAVHWRP